VTVQGATHPTPAYRHLLRHVYACRTCGAGARCEPAWTLVRQARREWREAATESG